MYNSAQRNPDQQSFQNPFVIYGDRPNITCFICYKAFSKKHVLRQHITAYHSVFYCQGCGLKIVGTQTKEFNNHLTECPQTLPPNTQCHYCPIKIYNNPELLLNHQRLCVRLRTYDGHHSYKTVLDTFDIVPEEENLNG